MAEQTAAPADDEAFDGPVGALMRAHDWSRSVLGPIDAWPCSLRSYVTMILRLPTPAIIFWGTEQIQLYNDGYAAIMGPRHPKYLAAPYRECWPDTYPTIHPWMERVLPTVESIVSRYGERTIFSRFITPLDPTERAGQWQAYFRKWPQATRTRLRPADLDLVRRLAGFVPPAMVVDKPAYSAFTGSRLFYLLVERHVTTVVVTGAETDVCVLSTVLSAVDLGFRVVIIEDALCSSSDTGHDALMTMYRTRFHGQIDLLPAEQLPELWRAL